MREREDVRCGPGWAGSGGGGTGQIGERVVVRAAWPLTVCTFGPWLHPGMVSMSAHP